MRRITGPVVLACMLVLACGEPPTAVTEQGALSPSFDALGNSGCYMVEYDYNSPGDWLAGDLVAAGGVGDPCGGRVTGKVFHEYCEYSFYITDSVVPDLIGEWVDFTEKTVYTFAAPGQAPIYRMNTSVRMFHNGVKIGNLTGHGTLTWSPYDITYTAKGQICM